MFCNIYKERKRKKLLQELFQHSREQRLYSESQRKEHRERQHYEAEYDTFDEYDPENTYTDQTVWKNPFYNALKCGDLDKIKSICQKHPSAIKKRVYYDYYPVHVVNSETFWSSSPSCAVKTMRLIVELGAEMNIPHRGYPPLHVVHSTELLKVFIESGSDVNSKSKHNKLTMIQYAVILKKVPSFINVLISNNAELNVPLHNVYDMMEYADKSIEKLYKIYNNRFDRDDSYRGPEMEQIEGFQKMKKLLVTMENRKKMVLIFSFESHGFKDYNDMGCLKKMIDHGMIIKDDIPRLIYGYL